MTDKRSRGRPRGTGKDDTVFLTMVADFMVKTPGLKHTTAMKRLVRQRTDLNAASPEAAVHRWQEKWKVQGEALLAAAHERAAPKPPVRISDHSRPRATHDMFARINMQVREAQKLMNIVDLPDLRAWRKMEEEARRALQAVHPFLPDLEVARKQVEQFEKQLRDIERWS